MYDISYSAFPVGLYSLDKWVNCSSLIYFYYYKIWYVLFYCLYWQCRFNFYDAARTYHPTLKHVLWNRYCFSALKRILIISNWYAYEITLRRYVSYIKRFFLVEEITKSLFISEPCNSSHAYSVHSLPTLR